MGEPSSTCLAEHHNRSRKKVKFRVSSRGIVSAELGSKDAALFLPGWPVTKLTCAGGPRIRHSLWSHPSPRSEAECAVSTAARQLAWGAPSRPVGGILAGLPEYLDVCFHEHSGPQVR